ncbi:hypothetical protein SAMN05428944_7660 [Streptomyces sp. 1222.5]|uniref:hypothetical protein n=1 Tax=unclassified Streptomyces TaxID=2593676 RepID=UPI00089D7E64|nr:MULTISPECIES: hypothetical protein [unclassified Streptomyces]PKW05324.1 hypothetical protein BX260_0426 [Streptomyces sp. 5112.2]SED43386.1 hypothetical protein SAMN05428944_7660 [Streptomyces sp. 1222.5]
MGRLLRGRRAAGAQHLPEPLPGHGHREHVYRYVEALEAEARRYAPAFREPDIKGPDVRRDDMHGTLRLVLPPGLHRIVHDSRRDGAELLLDHVGYGNLPHDSAWSSTERAAFEELAHDRLFDTPPIEVDGGTPVGRRAALERAQTGARPPETHLTFQVRVSEGADLPLHDVKASWVSFVDSPGIDVHLAGMSWRQAQQPWRTHRAVFGPPLDAAIKTGLPAGRRRLLPGPLQRDLGDLLPGQGPRRAETASPFEGREADIHAMAARLHEGVARRAERRSAGLPAPVPPAAPIQPGAERHPHRPGPGIP